VRDRRGIYLIEFAVAGNVLIILMMLGMEAALQTAIATALDHGAREASRTSALGPVGGLESRQLMLRRLLERAGLPLTAWAAEPADLRMQIFADYSALTRANPLPDDRSCPGENAWTETPGGSGRIIRYCVSFKARAFTPFSRALLPSGLFQHRTFFVVQNEPY
jgi:hypothetical protein